MAATITRRWEAHPELTNVWDDIVRLGLEENIAELNTYGLTIIEPDKVAPEAFIDRLTERILDLAEERRGVRPDVETGSTHRNEMLATLYYVVLKDRIFEEVVLNETSLAMVTYLLGESCILNTSSVLMKGPTDPLPDGLQLGLHSDNQMMPSPFPPYAQICNTTWLLSDYTKDNGSLCFVPGSHLLGRHPNPGEAVERAVPVEAPRGSLVVWHGNTWHGSFPRKNPGLRMALTFLWSRMYIVAREPLRDDVTQEILDRNPPRFAKLMGQHIAAGWRDDGPDFMKVAGTNATSLHF